MSGIIFLKTEKLNELKKFYTEKLDCSLWLDQGDCCIFQHDNLLLGFCEGETVDKTGLITFFYKTKEEVDEKYKQFKKTATDKPQVNEKYKIYQFFAKDPEGRIIEFQHFMHPIKKF